MYLAGLRIPDEDVRELIQLVDEPTRSFLEKALALESAVVALTIEDRERILWRSTMSERTRWQSFAVCCSKSTSGGREKGSSSFRLADRASTEMGAQARQPLRRPPEDSCAPSV